MKDDRIAGIGDLSQLKGAREISAQGLALAPGFIDTHTHDDRALLSDPLMECKISQGVTTVVTGNCGISLAPLSIDRYPPPPLDIIGREPQQFFADLRRLSVGAGPRAARAQRRLPGRTFDAARRRDGRASTAPPTASEIDAMRRTLEQALEQGAIGLSTGLYYPPAKDAPTDEIIDADQGGARTMAASTPPTCATRPRT